MFLFSSWNRNLIEVSSAHGSNGRIEFDSSGDMIAAEYTIYNVQGNSQKKELVPVGTWSAGPEAVMMKPRILWPGDKNGGNYVQPEGFEIPTHLRVGIPLMCNKCDALPQNLEQVTF